MTTALYARMDVPAASCENTSEGKESSFFIRGRPAGGVLICRPQCVGGVLLTCFVDQKERRRTRLVMAGIRSRATALV